MPCARFPAPLKCIAFNLSFCRGEVYLARQFGAKAFLADKMLLWQVFWRFLFVRVHFALEIWLLSLKYSFSA